MSRRLRSAGPQARPAGASLWGALAALALLGAAPARAPTALELRPVLDAGGGFAAMDVAVSFDGDADGSTVLKLPDQYGGDTELWKALSDLRAEGAAIAAGDGPSRRVLVHAPGAHVTVRYRISNTAGGDDVRGNDYRPLVQPTHFQLLGDAIVALPDGLPERAPATFRIDGLPAGATFASDLEHGELTVRDLVESVLVGGDFRVLDAGEGVRVAIRGTWSRDDLGWRTQLQRIGAAQRTYWRAHQEPYLVTLLPLARPPGNTSIGGTGRGDAFAFFATPNVPPERFDATLAHEMMHTWIPGRIGSLDRENEQLGYWLSEGFTDWASWRASVRGGVWGPEAFAEAFNEALEGYDLSPVRDAPNARIGADFWQDEEVQKLPYRRGMLLATLWDADIRVHSGGRMDLDDVLLEMQRTARRRPDVSATGIFPVAMRRVAQVDIAGDLASLVQDGARIELPVDVFAPCGRMVSERRTLWERGFDLDATRAADWKLAGVVEGSNAWLAGLRNGMDLRGWSERSDERFADRPVTARVRDAGVDKTITWLPAAHETRDVRRLVLDPAMDRAACIARLAGDA